MRRLWVRLFLEERPADALAFFRPFAAFAAFAHVAPTLLHLEDNYLAGTAFREQNLWFFTPDALAWVSRSPDALVVAMAGLFVLSALAFGLGAWTQASCIVMTACCYYFYALNSLHIGTLSFDILLVTLAVLCVTPYPGDRWSVDARRRGGPAPPRPVFAQRLLQMQMAATYFYTGLSKIGPGGNWIGDNPVLHLLNSAPGSVVKEFPLRAWFAAQPALCYAAGLGVVAMELALPFLWACRRTRAAGIALGWAFHVLLLVTLHVPSLFFFLFPPQMLLFLDPTAFEALRRRAVSVFRQSPRR